MRSPEQGGVWGVLGGAFDPVHSGHLALAREILRARNLAGVLFVPAYRHPFKGDRARASWPHRVAMLRLALAGDDRLRVCEIEAEQELSGYTLDTLRALKKAYPQAAFRFLVGADLLDQIDQWHSPEELLRETPVLAGARPGYQLKVSPGLPADRIELVPAETPAVSSTDLRALIGRGAPRPRLLAWLPAPVLDYIEKEGLYR
ncbi:MAG TPA: nicotinate (nicotinamide) nucleotide adenylyltransferase [candidate division Zixibacteria bacterium]|nr:nicotinate (nicotinamide) nucleotide adenylyltransferase [candidate division Zixibacteria bacterium]MDD4918695.1 nicotinate (nicotinamide) nucleotide adenylyltransferase [candidate division Zixibacteria bacterium]MDM7973960.1 nicotinate (nicotinamide) nucleotide adenylyltransferase [candidate division Zixibacteria bacterium]HOD65801.1 nicotinate (nicotinamide) nucleotide adenylyltransferase [candidate division Zixibacteria bacterium]HOZ06727.1 nicotinate (nicotinamide) nucleotide adenylyltra